LIMNPVQQAQEFLQKRVKALSTLVTGEASPNDYIDNSKFIAPLAAKPGVVIAHEMLKSAGTEGQSKMSGLGIGGNAPVYETPFNTDDAQVRDYFGIPGVIDRIN